jgi:NAD(P)-dependent dehydrogenase (short-subunit alcohol dehydrogenase family)
LSSTDSAPEAPALPLAGRVALVTGGGSGIGRATGLALFRSGAAVVLADRDHDAAERVATEIEGLGGQARGVVADVAEESDVEAMIGAAIDAYGRLDVLHNNAADSDPALMSRDGAIGGMEVEVWDRTLRVNLRGPMLGCKHAIPIMLKQGGGVIVNTSSASGLVGDLGRSAYAASKAGLQSLTLSVAAQYGDRGIRCNAIAPGVIETPALVANVPTEQVDVYRRNTLSPRLGRPEDIAAVVAFLASDAAAFLTGQVISVDGGMLSHHPAMAEIRRLNEGGFLRESTGE